jgi:lon-related putative ATP-dependent protease
MKQIPVWHRELQTRVRDLSRETLKDSLSHLVEELKQTYADLPEVVAFLDAALQDLIESGQSLREQPRQESESDFMGLTGTIALQRYQVNLMVDNSGLQGAPVIYEDNPAHHNIVGRVDQIAQMGTLVTNFLLVKAGALHRANGGYLVLDATKVLAQPYAWEGLKRALRAGRIQIESLGQVYGLISTLSLEPEPIPIDLKVVLIGERLLYYLLSDYDPDFQELFKVAADFESDVPRDGGNTRLYAQLVATLARAHGLKPLDAPAVGRVIEHAARLAGDAQKLTTHTRRITDLLREADHFAAQRGGAVVERADVEQALTAQVRRADRLRVRHQESIIEHVRLIDTDGLRAAQINGLAAMSLGDQIFAHPVRITAAVRLGEGDVIDIEREVELGGAIHSKGVMILSAFLGARFGRAMPLSLTASLVFEQSYGPVEGDSASLAELCALLSALAGAPIRQSLAVTGSVNQHGMVQAIGAVNQKIEGFFDICSARGLTGDQGVLIPMANVRNLMLREDVVRAAGDGRFHIYPVAEVDEAIELLTGIASGTPDEKGVVPEGSINHLVASQIAEMSARRQSFIKASRGGSKK